VHRSDLALCPQRALLGRVWGARNVGKGGGRERERTMLAREVAVAIGCQAAHNLSQRELADKLGWKLSVVSRLECLRCQVHATAVVRISDMRRPFSPECRAAWSEASLRQAAKCSACGQDGSGLMQHVAGSRQE